jgi:superfamily I DNA and/or RNA helicase
MFVQSAEHILVCANQNETADLLYEALDKIPMLSSRIIRVYPQIIIEDPNTVIMKNTYHKVFLSESQHREMQTGHRLSSKERKLIKDKIYKTYQIFVTTCGTASNNGTVFRYKFSRVLIDEATMVKENDLVCPIQNAK